MIREFFRGVGDYLKANRLVLREGMWKVIFVPGLISLCYFPAVVVGMFLAAGKLAPYATEHWMPELLQAAWMEWVIAGFFWVAGLFFGLLLFRTVVMVLYAPFLSYLSETTEKKASGLVPPDFTWRETLGNLFRAFSVGSITLSLSLVLVVLCWGLAFVPVVGGLLSLALVPLIQFYFAGVGFFDPGLERRALGIRESLRFSWLHRARILGNGLGFVLLLTVPVAGWFLAPSYGIIAGTLATAEIFGRRPRG